MRLLKEDAARLRAIGQRVQQYRADFPVNSNRWTQEAIDRDMLWQTYEYLLGVIRAMEQGPAA